MLVIKKKTLPMMTLMKIILKITTLLMNRKISSMMTITKILLKKMILVMTLMVILSKMTNTNLTLSPLLTQVERGEVGGGGLSGRHIKDFISVFWITLVSILRALAISPPLTIFSVVSITTNWRPEVSCAAFHLRKYLSVKGSAIFTALVLAVRY